MLGVFEKGNAKCCGDVSAVEVLCALIVGAPLKGNDGPEEDLSNSSQPQLHQRNIWGA